MGILSSIRTALAVIRDILIIIVLLIVLAGIAFFVMALPQLQNVMSEGPGALMQGLSGQSQAGNMYADNGQLKGQIVQGYNSSNNEQNGQRGQQKGIDQSMMGNTSGQNNLDPSTYINQIQDTDIRSALKQLVSIVKTAQDNNQSIDKNQAASAADLLIAKLSAKGLTQAQQYAQNIKTDINAGDETNATQDFASLLQNLILQRV